MGLETGHFVCVDAWSSSSKSFPSSTSTAPMDGSPITSMREPRQSGIPSNCMSAIRSSIATQIFSSSSNHEITPGNKWYWVVPGDDCQTIADKFEIAKEQFYALNPATGGTCKSLLQDTYVCVGVSGQFLLSTQTPLLLQISNRSPNYFQPSQIPLPRQHLPQIPQEQQ